MTDPQITNLRTARVEAAARAMAEWDGFDFDATDSEFVEASGVFKNVYRDGAHDALAAADAVVTVEMIADEIAGHPIGSGYYQTTIGIDEAREIAEVVHRLYRGEQDDD